MAVSTKEILRNFEAASGNEVTLPPLALGCVGSGCPCARCQDEAGARTKTGGLAEGEVEAAAEEEEEEFTLEEGSTAKFLSRSMVGGSSFCRSGSPKDETMASLGEESTSADSGLGISGTDRGSSA